MIAVNIERSTQTKTLLLVANLPVIGESSGVLSKGFVFDDMDVFSERTICAKVFQLVQVEHSWGLGIKTTQD